MPGQFIAHAVDFASLILKPGTFLNCKCLEKIITGKCLGDIKYNDTLSLFCGIFLPVLLL